MYIFVKQNIDNVYGNFLYLFDIERIQFCIKNNFGMADTNTVGFFFPKDTMGISYSIHYLLNSFVDLLPATVKAWRILRNSLILHKIVYYQI